MTWRAAPVTCQALNFRCALQCPMELLSSKTWWTIGWRLKRFKWRWQTCWRNTIRSTTRMAQREAALKPVKVALSCHLQSFCFINCPHHTFDSFPPSLASPLKKLSPSLSHPLASHATMPQRHSSGSPRSQETSHWCQRGCQRAGNQDPEQVPRFKVSLRVGFSKKYLGNFNTSAGSSWSMTSIKRSCGSLLGMEGEGIHLKQKDHWSCLALVLEILLRAPMHVTFSLISQGVGWALTLPLRMSCASWSLIADYQITSERWISLGKHPNWNRFWSTSWLSFWFFLCLRFKGIPRIHLWNLKRDIESPQKMSKSVQCSMDFVWV